MGGLTPALTYAPRRDRRTATVDNAGQTTKAKANHRSAHSAHTKQTLHVGLYWHAVRVHPRFSLALARVTNVSCRLQPGTTLLVTLATAEERHERVTSIVGGICGTSSQDVNGISPHKFDARLRDG